MENGWCGLRFHCKYRFAIGIERTVARVSNGSFFICEFLSNRLTIMRLHDKIDTE